ncbi:MAG TPA: histidine phosphatase family protein [Kofleriaceae bacterium]|nr:histidine phosphatase family protein [Kofleriaceae bacterium]
MELFIVRHAVAVPQRPDLPDEARPLTPEGRHRFERAVRGMKKLGIDFDRLYHSPWLRAIETAELLTRLVREGGETMVEPGLTRSPDAAFLASLQGERVAAVGHEPWMSEMLSILVCGTVKHADRFDFRKGGLAWLEGDLKPRRMWLRAFLPPRALRRM